MIAATVTGGRGIARGVRGQTRFLLAAFVLLCGASIAFAGTSAAENILSVGVSGGALHQMWSLHDHPLVTWKEPHQIPDALQELDLSNLTTDPEWAFPTWHFALVGSNTTRMWILDSGACQCYVNAEEYLKYGYALRPLTDCTIRTAGTSTLKGTHAGRLGTLKNVVFVEGIHANPKVT